MLYVIPVPVGAVTEMVPVAVEHVGWVTLTVGWAGIALTVRVAAFDCALLTLQFEA
jgi:hypothetical protein